MSEGNALSPHYVVMCVMAREMGPKISLLRVFQKDRGPNRIPEIDIQLYPRQ